MLAVGIVLAGEGSGRSRVGIGLRSQVGGGFAITEAHMLVVGASFAHCESPVSRGFWRCGELRRVCLPGCSPEHRILRRRHVKQLDVEILVSPSILKTGESALHVRGVDPAALGLRLAVGGDEADLSLSRTIAAVFLLGRRRAHCERRSSP